MKVLIYNCCLLMRLGCANVLAAPVEKKLKIKLTI